MKPLRIRSVPRERDDQVLDWIRRYEAGESMVEIARKDRLPNYQTVQTAINAVLDTPEGQAR